MVPIAPYTYLTRENRYYLTKIRCRIHRVNVAHLKRPVKRTDGYLPCSERTDFPGEHIEVYRSAGPTEPGENRKMLILFRTTCSILTFHFPSTAALSAAATRVLQVVRAQTVYELGKEPQKMGIHNIIILLQFQNCRFKVVFSSQSF